ncbi:putative glutathione S-transferase [Acetobacteraceae bacterium AT-5844]|nr:putative glutathione S-transferase [Acetobacteraceae bacterium AT-5844]
MKLYYTPGVCSLAPHIALREAGLPFELEKVDIRAGKLASGEEYAPINGKGYVPALVLENGEMLTEGPAISQYIADQAPASNLAPAPGTMARYRLQEWLNFISTELHKGIGAFFNPAMTPEWRAAVTPRLNKRLAWLAQQLEGRSYLMGDTFTVADAYLFTVLRWTKAVNVDLSAWPVFQAYSDRVAARPHVAAAMQAEGLA